ncbi:MAG: serine/threonine protein kinase [Lachnospiraceae bacterium]|nr:serine/threonine protein kinase [Lachnospiraceae bacterium]
MYGDCNREKIVGGKYTILGMLGEGGFGKVYLVKDEHIDKIYAMKIQPLNECTDYKNEFRMLRVLEHPGLPALHDAMTDESYSYIVMENVQGTTLQNYVKERGHLSIKETIKIALGLCEILSYLHRRPVPVIHGDLKPSNIMTDEGKIRLVDLGCALTAYSKNEVTYGTPEYAAPEQSQGSICTGSDVYSFGKVMFYMLTGRTKTVWDCRQLKKELKAYGIPRKLRKIILKCLQPCPELRYPGGGELEEALRKIKDTGRHFPGAFAGCVAMMIRVVGIVMMLYCLFYNKILEYAGQMQYKNNVDIKTLFIMSLLVFLLAIPWDALARTHYKTAVLECECSILVTEGSCKCI